MDTTKHAFFPLETGPVTIGIRFDIPESTRAFGRYFSGYRGIGGGDLKLDVTVASHADFPTIPESLVQAKKWTGDRFSIGDDLFTGGFNRQRGCWEISVKNIMTKGQITRVFEQFLYQAFYSACRLAGSDAILLHSCGVNVDGSGYLFVGASGMGKSTVAGLSRAYGVVNDEMNILSFGDSELRLCPSPFNAYFSGKCVTASPVRAVFLLRHDAVCRLEAASPGEAAAGITGQVVPPIALEDAYTPAASAAMMGAAIKITAAVPVYKLYFPVTGGFWPLILEKFGNGA